MIVKKIITKHARPLCSVLLLTISASYTHAFELLSEGAMESVSITSGPILNNNLPEPESDDGYERLPFETSVRIDASDTDEVSSELDFALTQEVEVWADHVRENNDALFEISIIDALPASSAGIPELNIEVAHGKLEEFGAIGDKSGKVAYQRGDQSHSTQILDASHNSITVQHSSYVERAATIDANPYLDGSSYGSTFLTGIQASSWHRTTQRD